MTNQITAALAKYAAAYRAYQIAQGRTFNIEVATQYATTDLFNMVKNYSEANAVSVILDEADYMNQATEKVAA